MENTSQFTQYGYILSQITAFVNRKGVFFLLQSDYNLKQIAKQAIERLKLTGKIPVKIDEKEFGHYLKYLRTTHHIQQYKLALIAYKSATRLSEYENTKRIPSIQSLEAIIRGLRFYGVSEPELEALRQKHSAKLESSSAHVLSAVYQANNKDIIS